MTPAESNRASATAARILQQATELFRSEGYDRVPVARITKAAGVAKGTFFLHFPTKEHVLFTLFDAALEEEEAELGARGLRGTDALIALFDRLADRFLARDPEVGRAIALHFPANRLRRRVAARLDESLPVTLPIDELPNPDLASLLVAGLAHTLVEGIEAGGNAAVARRALARRTLFLLRSAGLPADPPPR